MIDSRQTSEDRPINIDRQYLTTAGGQITRVPPATAGDIQNATSGSNHRSETAYPRRGRFRLRDGHHDLTLPFQQPGVISKRGHS